MTDPAPLDGAAAVVAQTIDGLERLRSEVESVSAGRRHVLIAARGSSENAAIYATYLLQTEAHLAAGPLVPSVCTHYHATLDLTGTMVIAISSAGEGADVAETLAWAARAGATTIALTAHPESPVGKAADVVVPTIAVPDDECLTYASQISAVAWLVSVLSDVDPRLGEQLAAAPTELMRLQRAELDFTTAVEAVQASDQTYVVSRGLCLGAAHAAARRIQAGRRRPVVGLSWTDLRHGPLDAIDESTTVVVVAASDGPLVEPLRELAENLRTRGAAVVGMGGDETFRRACTTAIEGTGLAEELAPLGLAVLVERLAAGLRAD